jgi:starch-binding outer membrane protein, SusD/RagB family
MVTLNALLVNRFDSSFVPISVSNTEQALDTILDHRRKELCFRGSIRWMDIRRLNQFENSKITLTRKINGREYTLAPGDPHFAFLIPQNSIDNSHIKQNAR